MAWAGTTWLTVMNIVLGALTAAFVLIVALECLCAAVCRLRKRRSVNADLNHDMAAMFPPDSRAVGSGGPGSLDHVLRSICRTWRRLTRRPERF